MLLSVILFLEHLFLVNVIDVNISLYRLSLVLCALFEKFNNIVPHLDLLVIIVIEYERSLIGC